MDAGDNSLEPREKLPPSFATLSAYHLVHSRTARWLWTTAALFWLGFTISLKIDWLAAIYDSIVAAYLRILLFPSMIMLVLLARTIRAWINCREWLRIEIPEDGQLPPRSGAARINPYHDPLNPQSGLLHLRHFGFWDD